MHWISAEILPSYRVSIEAHIYIYIIEAGVATVTLTELGS